MFFYIQDLIYMVRSLNVLESAIGWYRRKCKTKVEISIPTRIIDENAFATETSNTLNAKRLLFETAIETTHTHTSSLMKEYLPLKLWNGKHIKLLQTQTIVFYRLLCASIHLLEQPKYNLPWHFWSIFVCTKTLWWLCVYTIYFGC